MITAERTVATEPTKPTGPAADVRPEFKPTEQRPGRLVPLDLMRGYFVLILASIHLDYMPSVLGYLDGRGRLWVSEAEGFFLISGLLVAVMRRRDLEGSGLGLAARRSWARAGKLYVVACGLTLAYTGLGRAAAVLQLSGAPAGLDTDSSWWDVVRRTLNLHYVYGWADFLTYYAPLFVVAPVLVWLMAHRLGWAVVLASVAAYESMSVIPGFWGASGAFIQWQVYFVIGAAIGYHLPEITRWLEGMSPARRARRIRCAIVAAASLYGLGTLLLWAPSLQPTGDWYDRLMFDGRLGLLRPVVALVMFVGGYALLHRLQRPLMATVGPLLTLFGRNSMYVYILQSAFVFAIPFVVRSHGIAFDTALDSAVIAAIWLGLRTRFGFRVIPR